MASEPSSGIPAAGRPALADQAWVTLPRRAPRVLRARRAAMVAGVLSLALLAGGCSGARKALGFEKQSSPDEFAVMPRSSLVMPPDFALRPPSADATGPKEASSTEVAKQTVFRAAGDVPDISMQQGTESSGERSLLASANAANADPQIRKVVTEDAAQIYPTEPSLTQRLIFWRKPELPGEVVDASKEQQRLKENAALNKPATEGDSPSIKRHNKALFEGLF